MRDIGPGCEGVDAALDRWLGALAAGNTECLHEILTDDFLLSCDPAIAGGRMTKQEFITFDENIREANIEVLSLTARRYKDTAITQVFAKVDEKFSAEPSGVSPEAINAIVGSGRTLAYATGWRAGPDGQWRCFQHHLFGPID